ncbi:hypothetical protein QR680_001057 [Steinernema hermaphroditum]|uniref:protein-tyrosine-phosphatase n=1 Tax=Steinernema hermaphroditum TaxID=289476 RepID=A0AA39GWU1_9BILA|nr:hypothetical protein QR680_001057 [Steinernema hermaphroditum]
MFDQGMREIQPCQLAECIRQDRVVVVDCRSFMEYNNCHVRGAVNAFYSKMIRRRIQKQGGCCDFINKHLSQYDRLNTGEKVDLVLYGSGRSCSTPNSCADTSSEAFLAILYEQIVKANSDRFRTVMVLKGGFVDFHLRFPELCDSSEKVGGANTPVVDPSGVPLTTPSMSSFPCFDNELENVGPTQIFPFLYLGSQQDALNEEVMQEHNITYVLNLSVNCPRPGFINDDTKFIRFPVNDTATAKLLPHFEQAFDILEQVRARNEVALVHCLAGISRSPTMAVAYVMRYKKMNQDEAYKFVKERRPTISPNFNFMSQLFEYEKMLQKMNILTPPPSASVSPISNTNTSNSVNSSDDEKCPKTAPVSLNSTLPKSASLGHVASSSTFRLQRPTRMFDIPSSPGVNEYGKRASDTPYPKHERPKQLFPSLPLTTPTQEVKPLPEPKLQRPTRFGNNRQRRPGHIGHGEQRKELPSPSTEFERLTFSTPQEMSISNPIFASSAAAMSALQQKSLNKSKYSLTPSTYTTEFPTISESCPIFAANPVFQSELSSPRSQSSSQVEEEKPPTAVVTLRENYNPGQLLDKPESLSSSSLASSPFLSPHYSMDTESPESGYVEASVSPNTELAPREDTPPFESNSSPPSETTPERSGDLNAADAESLSSSSSLEIVVV